MNGYAVLAAALVVAASPVAIAQSVSNTSWVVDGAGQWTAAGSVSNISAVAQPGGVMVSSAGDVRNYAGFLGTFILRPSLDTDGDGAANELDTDNDNDGLDDETELTGSAFIPATVTDLNKRDSDGDGASDGDEARAGTNPNDSTMSLHITSIDKGGSGVMITWQAKAGKRYAVYALDSADSPRPGTQIGLDVIATGGAGPWYAVHAEKTDTATLAKRFYYVKVIE